MPLSFIRQVGDFTGSGHTEMLFYTPQNGDWQLGHFSDTHMHWTLVGNTSGFGNLLEDHRFWLGHFTNPTQIDLLFYTVADSNWWLGRFSAMQLRWSLACNTSDFGDLNDDRPFWVGDFLGTKHDDLLFYTPGDSNWWLGHFSASQQLKWSKACNTADFGNLNDGRPFWTGNFLGSSQTDLLFYSSSDNHWWLGHFSANQLYWTLAHPNNAG
jgi:hypothetical protein